jgi:hypothetical protein
MDFATLAFYSRVLDPAAFARFLKICREQGIDIPTGSPTGDDTSTSLAVDDSKERPPPARYDGRPAAGIDGHDVGWCGDDAPKPRSAEGQKRFKSLAPMALGPVRGPQGQLRIHCCCPGAYRAQEAAKARARYAGRPR